MLNLFDELWSEESTSICGLIFSEDFTTSADVVRNACGLPLEAIRVVAREQGVKIDDPACSNIKLDLLAALADAHVRHIKAYYRNAQRYVAQLGGNELTTFVDFCETFKKRHVDTVCSWDDIDIDAIKERFFRKVKELTPHKDDILEALLSERSDVLYESAKVKFVDTCPVINRLSIYQNSINPFSNQARYRSLDDTWRKYDVIERVVTSACYGHCPKHIYYNIDLRRQIRTVTLSARFYIFIDEDEHHLNSNFVYNKYKLLTGALEMTA